MKIECVTVCVNFSDVLAHTLPLNKRHFDAMVVVTDTRDEATWRLCRHHHVRCVPTDAFYVHDQAFNKGMGINAGLAALRRDAWLVHLDADIVLPPRTRELLETSVHPDEDCIHGIDRMMCPDFEGWMRHVTDPVTQHADGIFIVPEPFGLGARVAKLDGEGYVPIGFFQMWHAGASGIADYPDHHGTAGRADMLHALRWPRRQRVLIPELIGIHLEGPIAPGVKNWRGRRMAHFGLPPDDAARRRWGAGSAERAGDGGGYGG